MRVLVTGGHGFIGQHVVDALLAQGASVRCLHRRPTTPQALAARDVEVVSGDVARAQGLDAAVQGCTHVLHLAGLTRSLTRKRMWNTNVRGTLRLFDAASRAGLPGRFVFCSSQAAVGPAPTPVPLCESEATTPALSWYGQSKRAAEIALKRRVGPQVVSLRPPAVYGPYDTDFLTLFQGVARGFAPLLGGPHVCYSMVYAQDLAQAFAHGLTGGAGPGPYFVTHPEVVSAEAVIQAAETAVGRTARRIRLPVSTLRLVGTTADLVSQLSGKASILGGQRMREVAAKHWVCDGAAFVRDTGWEPRIPMEEGFKRTADWYRRNGQLSGTVR